MTKNNKPKKVGIRDSRSEISFSIAFSKKDVTMKEYDQYVSVLIKGGAPRGDPGEPALPWRKYFISMPKDAIPKKVTIGQMRIVPLAKNVTIEPCQPNVPTILGSKVSWVPPNSRVYASDKVWPKASVRLIGRRQLGDFYLGEIEFCPFRYQARSKSLELVERIDLTLTFTLSSKKRREKKLLPTAWQQAQYNAKRVKEMVLNPQDVIIDEAIQKDLTPTPAPPLPSVDHMIVTTLNLASNFQRLAEWRTALGLRSRVVTVEDIVAGSVPDTGGSIFWQTSGYYDGGTRDIAEAIRNFLKWANLNWQTKYVLLGGDTEVIPSRQALHSAVGTASYWNLNTPDTSVNVAYSAQASSLKTGSTAANVMDDNVSTVWECSATDSDPWIRLTMSLHTPVNRVDLQWGSTHATAYSIEISPDGTTWTSVYSTSSAPGGSEQVTFNCASGRYIRLHISSGTGFALAAVRVYGPHLLPWWPGEANTYSIGATVSRLHLNFDLQMNPTNSPGSDLVLIKEGTNAGTVIPYDLNASAANLGWFFIDDLVNPQPSASTVVTRFIEIRGPAQFHGNSFVVKSDWNYIATDLYYSDMLSSQYPAGSEHDWDANRNLVYGEQFSGQMDGVNGLSDVFLGRAPVETQAEADNFIDKVIRYEKFRFLDQQGNEAALPQDFAVSVLLGSQNWSANTVGVLDLSAQGKENIRKDFLAVDAARWIFTLLYQDHADVPAADQGPDLAAASNAAIMAAIAAGQNIVSLTSHGSSGYLCYLQSVNVDDEFSPPAVWYGNACSTNKFDVSTGEAISELSILNNNGQATAYVGNSRYGWTGDNPIERTFWAELFVSGELGRMLAEAHLAGWEWTRYALNLLGDPAMRVWSDRPIQLTVTHATEVYIGFMTIPPSEPPSQTFDVRVSSDGSPVSGASVCLVLGNSLFVTGTTDASGLASLQISPAETGMMSVSVSGRDALGRNMIPYQGSVEVKRNLVCCTLQVSCGERVTCTHILSCRERITCALPVSCKPLIHCGPQILCQHDIACNKYIACGSLISCSAEIVCKSKIFCGAEIACPSTIACGPGIVCGARICVTSIGICTKLRPEEFDIFSQIREIWGIGDMDEFVCRFDSPEVSEAFERLPLELKKPIRMMVERIKKDVSH